LAYPADISTVDLTLSPEQDLLLRSAQDFLAGHCPMSVVRRLGWPESDGDTLELLQAACELGWAGLAIPASLGGSGGNLVDQAVLAEQLGQALFPTLLASSTSAALTIAAATTPERAALLLPGILDGSLPAAVCWPDASGAGVKLSAQPGQLVVGGEAGLVADAMTASWLVVPAQPLEDGALQLAVVATDQPGVHRRRIRTLDGARHAEVSFAGASIRPEHALAGGVPGPEAVASSLRAATALQCVEMVGVARAALVMTTDYVTNRYQFGRPIGSFQAVQHHVADMAIGLDAARLAAYQAVWSCTEGRDAARQVALAKVAANRAAREVTLMAHQLHGGIGYSTEHRLHLFSDRAAAAMLTLGTTDDHLTDLGKILAGG
jgi:alkylation response protein AidB-like acyl-CoA dehydrogenase